MYLCISAFSIRIRKTNKEIEICVCFFFLYMGDVDVEKFNWIILEGQWGQNLIGAHG